MLRLLMASWATFAVPPHIALTTGCMTALVAVPLLSGRGADGSILGQHNCPTAAGPEKMMVTVEPPHIFTWPECTDRSVEPYNATKHTSW